MDLTPQDAALLAAVPAALLVLAHLGADRVRRSIGLPEPVVVSVAGGISVAYVFLHLLPEVAAGSAPVRDTLAEVTAPTPLHELAVFAVALLGFTVFYGLERLAERSGSPRGEGGARGADGDGPGGGSEEPSTSAFAAHVGVFAVYNAAVTYTLGSRLEANVLGAALYTVAIGVHVLVVDRGLSEHYPRRFRRVGRFVLGAAMAVGWLASVLAAPTSTFVVVLLTAAVAGTVLLTVFKEELPTARRSRFGWFLVGLVGYAVLLVVLAAVAPGAEGGG